VTDYELRWALVAVGGVPTAGTTLPITSLRSAMVIARLTPCTTYAFHQLLSFRGDSICAQHVVS
jgi:hypothetical protein